MAVVAAGLAAAVNRALLVVDEPIELYETHPSSTQEM